MFKGIRTTAIVAGLIKIGKTAIDTASALEEVQNVVDVSFGASANEINLFAKNAIKQFGLSELSAKKMASAFMAMANGMDINIASGKQMATTLTGLAGDMASFYNVSVDIAETALHSVFTGETESLKKFGIILTEANLQQYAYSQGIKKTVSSMSQAEKVALRYQYVLHSTSKVQGDFVRTGGNWANQIRVLKEQWSQLLSILGRGLIAVLKPVVEVLNEMLASLIAVGNAMAKAFGGKGIESATGSVSSSIGDINEGTGDMAGGFDDATSSAKKLEKTLAGFDELNVLSSNQSASGSGGGLGSGGATVEGSGSLVETPEMDNPASKLQLYLRECKMILEKWATTIPKLEIHFDKEQALEDVKAIGLNILNTIAGWGSFVISIAIKVANDLDIGKLANSFLGLVESATNLASAITDAVVPALITFYEQSGLQDIVKWIGEKFASGLDGLAGKLDEWAQWFRDNKETIGEFAGKLGEVIEPLSQIVIKIADVAWSAFASILSTINDLVQNIATWLINLDTTRLATLVYSIITLAGAFSIAKSVAGLFGIKLSTVLLHPVDTFLSFVALLKEVVIPAILSKLDILLAGATKIFGALKGAVIAVGGAIKSAVLGVVNFLIANPIALIITAIVGLIALIAVKGDEIQAILGKVGDFVKSVFVRDWTEAFGPIIGNVLNGFIQAMNDMWSAVTGILNGIIDLIRGVFTGDWERAWEGVVEIFGSVMNGMEAVVKAPVNVCIGILNAMISAVVAGVNLAIKAINRLKVSIPSWVPGVGGKSFSVSIAQLKAPKIPLLANGGVITQPTVAMMGEYSGARNNPEIVTPQALLQEIITSSNDSIVEALIQQTKQLLVGLEQMNMEVCIGDDVIAQSAHRGNQAYRKRTGKPLFV